MEDKTHSIFFLIYGKESLPQAREALSTEINNLNTKCESLLEEWKTNNYADHVSSGIKKNTIYHGIIKNLSWPW